MEVKLKQYRDEIGKWNEKIQEILQILNMTEDNLMNEIKTDGRIINKGKRRQQLADGSFFREGFMKESTIYMTPSLQSQILHPDNSAIDKPVVDCFEDLHVNFTAEERAKLYEYTMQNTRPITLTTNCERILDPPGNSEGKTVQAKTKLELMAEERNRKRRRISHKAKKSVYTNKKTPVEILREIIENQMENLLQNDQY